MNYPVELQYTKSHEWVKTEGDVTVVGISDFAQDALGDVVFVNLPGVGDEVTAEEAFGDVESVKAVSDLISPVSGVVLEVNEELLGQSRAAEQRSLRQLAHQGRAGDRYGRAAGCRRLRGLLRAGGLTWAAMFPTPPKSGRRCCGPSACTTSASSTAMCPRPCIWTRPLDLPSGMSELEVRRTMTELAGENKVFSTILRGAGAYDHYIPSIVKYIPAKEEFLTAYTPYQAELSQGILQSIFEYQTMICELTGMDVSNASVYDGATAAAEAAAMCRDRKRRVTLISGTAHPDVINTVRTYCYGTGDELRVIPVKDGKTDPDALRELLTAGDVSGVCVQQPNFFGQLEDAEALGEIIHAAGALYILSCNPIALGILKTPKECGADIAVGEGQPLGMPLGWGGPYLGFMASTSKHMRKLPGRIVGQTVDSHGERCFVLSLQAREQHIRREKASSNICSNEALCALTAGVYLSAMGPEGLAEAARQSMAKAHYLARGLAAIEGVTLRYSGEFFHEFVTALPKQDEILAALEQADILGGLPLEGGILWCATEKVAARSAGPAPSPS